MNKMFVSMHGRPSERRASHVNAFWTSFLVAFALLAVVLVNPAYATISVVAGSDTGGFYGSGSVYTSSGGSQATYPTVTYTSPYAPSYFVVSPSRYYSVYNYGYYPNYYSYPYNSYYSYPYYANSYAFFTYSTPGFYASYSRYGPYQSSSVVIQNDNWYLGAIRTTSPSGITFTSNSMNLYGVR